MLQSRRGEHRRQVAGFRLTAIFVAATAIALAWGVSLVFGTDNSWRHLLGSPFKFMFAAAVQIETSVAVTGDTSEVNDVSSSRPRPPPAADALREGKQKYKLSPLDAVDYCEFVRG